MIDEQVLLRRYMRETTDPLPDAMDLARESLIKAIAEGDREGIPAEHQMPPSPWGSRRRGVLVAVAIIIVAAVICVPLLTSTAGPRRSARITAPNFRLTGDIQQMQWQAGGTPGSQSYQLACPSTQECFVTEPSHPSNAQTAPDGIVEASHDGGQTWAVSLDVPRADLVGLTCPNSSNCVVTGENFASGNPGVSTYVTTDAGATWVSASSPGASLSSGLMSCSSIAHCVTTTSQAGPNGIGIQSSAEVTEDGGQSWQTYPFPGPFRPSQLECIDQRCVALGEAPPGYLIQAPSMIHGIAAAAYSSDGGRSWTMGSLPTADETNGLSCADALHCFGIEETVTSAGSSRLGPVGENVITSGDGGVTWTTTAGNDPAHWLLGSISCPTALECWITGSVHQAGQSISQAYANYESPDAPTTFVKVTYDGGTTWTSALIPSIDGVTIKSVGSITCVDASSCFAIAQDPTSPAGPSQRQLVISTPSLPS